MTLLLKPKNGALTPPASAAVGLRYLRDRISVPRDMSHAARALRGALEATAALDVRSSPCPYRCSTAATRTRFRFRARPNGR